MLSGIMQTQVVGGVNTSGTNLAVDSDAQFADAGTINNIAIGSNALNSTTDDATYNIAIGSDSGTSITTGDYNICVGSKAGEDLTSDSDNIAIGYESLYNTGNSTNDCDFNIAIGTSTMAGTHASAGGSSKNVAVGYQAMGTGALSDADANVAIGYQAGKAITEGNNNVLIGHQAADVLTVSDFNIAIGAYALSDFTAHGSTVDAHNTAIGGYALTNITTGINNIAIGGYALYTADGAETRNMAIGINAMRGLDNDSAASNIAIGYNAGRNMGTLANVDNIFLGDYAGGGFDAGGSTAAWQTAVSLRNIGIGNNSLGDQLNGALDNIAIGDHAGGTLKEADYLIAIGSGAANKLQDTDKVIAIGHDACAELVDDGERTIAIGYEVMNDTSGWAGSDNIFIGHSTANEPWNTALSYANTVIGSQAASGQMNNSYHNTAIGYGVLNAMTTGFRNSSCGSGSLGILTEGDENTCMGYEAGKILTTGNYNVIIGAHSEPSALGSNSQIVIGRNVAGTGDNIVTIGVSANTASLALDGTTTAWSPASSDERLKENIQSCDVGLAFINELRPVTYNWKKAKDAPKDMPQYVEGSEEPVLGFDYGVEYHGFIAQEVKEAINKHEGIKDSFKMWQLKDDGTQTVADGAVVPMVVKAIQELSTQIEELKSKIGDA